MKKGLLHHIELNVSDLKRTVEFWDWLKNEGIPLFRNGKVDVVGKKVRLISFLFKQMTGFSIFPIIDVE